MLRIVIYLLILAAVVYGVFFVLDRRAVGGDEASPRRGRRPVGPDDDESFLHELDERAATRPSRPVRDDDPIARDNDDTDEADTGGQA